MHNPCNIELFRVDNGYLFRIVGGGTLRESSTVHDLAFSAMKAGADVLFDLSGCEYLDSTFLGCLVLMQQEGQRDGGSFGVFADESVRRRLFATSHVDRLLVLVERLPECTGAPVRFQLKDLQRKELCRHLLDTHRKMSELGGPAAEAFQRIAERLQEELDGFAQQG